MRLQAYEVVYQTMEKGEHSDSISTGLWNRMIF